MELSDRELLDRYLAGRDEAAFRLLVGRYLDLVHGVARRVTRNDELARDVAQAVLLRLASRAAMIPSGVSLTAWLHRTTQSRAADLVRGEERRKKREQAAMAVPMNADEATDRDPPWERLSPVIDQLIDALPSADREIVLARFYRNESHAAIAERLGLSEALARKRTSRALEKLRTLLGRRGIATTSSALATLLPAHAALSPAPAALMGSILQAAGGVTPLVPSGLHAVYLLMNATQKTLIAAAAMVFLAALGYSVRPLEAVTPAASLPGTRSAHGEGTMARNARRPGKIERTLPATAEGRLKRLDEILTIGNAVTRRREMLAFTSLLQRGQFEELCSAFNHGGGTDRVPGGDDVSAEHRILVAAWARKDPRGALERLRKGWMSYSAPKLATALGAAYPEKALEWAKEPGIFQDSFLSGIGSVELPTAVGFIRELPEKDRGQMLHFLWSGMIDEPRALERIAALVESGPDKNYLVRKVGEMEADRRPESLVRMLMENPEAMQQANVDAIFSRYASKDSEAAIRALAELPDGSVRRNAVTGVAEAIARKDPEQALELLDRYPEASSDSLIAKLALKGIGQGNEPEALARLGKIGDAEMREREQLKGLRFWRNAKPEEAQAWIDGHASELSPGVLAGLREPEASGKVIFRPLPTP